MATGVDQPRIGYTWREFDTAVDAITAEVKALPGGYQPTCVVGIPRGGLPLAVALSNKLGLPYRQSPPLASVNRILLVDDILDTGQTMETTCRFHHLKDSVAPIIATWLWRDGTPKPEYAKQYIWAATIPPQIWAVFPWETQ